MDNAVELSDTRTSSDDEVKSEKSTSKSDEFGPSFAAWEKLKRQNRSRVILTAAAAFIIGACIGAGVVALIFTQVYKIDDMPLPSNMTYEPYRANTTTLQVTTTPEPTTTAIATTTTSGPVYDEELCPAIYEGKCFRAIQGDLDVHYERSVKLCKDIGWKLANIYSTSHYFMLEGYLRTTFPPDGYVSAWTGMSYVPQDDRLVTSEGVNVALPGIRWYYGYPINRTEDIHVGIDVLYKPTTSTVLNQGVWNYDSTWFANSALCEEP